jgi:hypothetical protein
MNRRVAKKILSACDRVGWRRTSYSLKQVTQAKRRLCRRIMIPITPRGWLLPCWLRSHGVHSEQITRFDDTTDGQFNVEWWGDPEPECSWHIGEPHRAMLSLEEQRASDALRHAAIERSTR